MNPLAERLIQPGSPFELSTTLVEGDARRRFRHCPAGLSEVYRNAQRSADAVCLRSGNTETRFAQLLDEASHLAHRLIRHHGIRAGSRVAILSHSSPAWFAAFIAATGAGASAVLIDPEKPTRELLAMLQLARCEVLVADRQRQEALWDLGERCATIVIGNDAPPFFEGEAAVPTPDRHWILQAMDPEAEALVAFTSGSTGVPKGVRCTHRAVLSGLMNMSLARALAGLRVRQAPTRGASPSSILLSPFFHVSGYAHLLLMMQVAGTVVPWRGAFTAEMLPLIAAVKATSISGLNAEGLTQLLAADLSAQDLSSLMSIGVHGSALRPHLIQQLREHLPAVALATGYGLTETNGSIALALGSELLERPGSCGAVVPSVEVRIVNHDGAACAAGAAGEIWIRGAMLMSGYCGQEERTARVLQNGWFKTGDFGHMDSNGFLYVEERREELLDWGDRLISCAKLEQALCASMRIQDAAVMEITAMSGERRLLVAVVPAHVTSDLAASVGEHLTREHALLPAQFDIVTLEQMPRTATGKIDRRALREGYAAG
jgi:long-chain acyl-CoA synthetase